MNMNQAFHCLLFLMKATWLNIDEVGGDISQLYEAAKNSMDKWRKKYDKAVKLAKLEPHAEKKTFPFEDASNVIMPFILETMLDFHSRTVPEMVWRDNVVGVKLYGAESEEKTARSGRVGDYMNYQITEEIKHWRKEQDKLLLQLLCVP